MTTLPPGFRTPRPSAAHPAPRVATPTINTRATTDPFASRRGQKRLRTVKRK